MKWGPRAKAMDSANQITCFPALAITLNFKFDARLEALSRLLYNCTCQLGVVAATAASRFSFLCTVESFASKRSLHNISHRVSAKWGCRSKCPALVCCYSLELLLVFVCRRQPGLLRPDPGRNL